LFLAFAIQGAIALPTSYYASGSLLSSGKWVKVKVSSTGMQEIPFSRLRELGFSDPSKVAVYGYSGVELEKNEFSTSLPDDLPAVPVASYGDKLVFYGVASEVPVEYVRDQYVPTKYKVKLRRNLSNDCAYYFLTDSRPRLEVETSDVAVADGQAAVETAHGLVWNNFTDRQIGAIGAYLFGENIVDSGTVTYPVGLPAYDPSGDYAPGMVCGVALKAASPGRVEFSVAGASTQPVSVQSYGNDPGHMSYCYAASNLDFKGMSKTADDIYRVTVDPRKSGDPLTEAALDYYAFSYPRTTDVSAHVQHFLSFPELQVGQPVKLVDSPVGVKVWDVTSIRKPKEITVKKIDSGGNVGFVADRKVAMTMSEPGLQTVVFNPDEDLCQVEVVGEVASQNCHGMDVPQMLVVASAKTYDAALELAGLHKEKTGVDVAVVPFDEVCNEFASGLHHPMAVRRLVKMLYDRDPSRLQALLIFARAFSDNTGLTATESPEDFADTYIPMFQCEDISGCGYQPTSYATDVVYAMLSDDFRYDSSLEKGHLLRCPLDIKIGRVPAANEGEALAFVVKARNYLDNVTAKAFYNRAIMTADMGDENLHVQQAKKMRDLLADIAPATVLDMHVQALYNPIGGSNESMRRRLRQQLHRGVGMWFFLGHSLTCTQIGSGQLWSNAYDKELYNDTPPFTVYGTCQTLVMDSPATSLQIDMLFNTNGGMIAGVGAARPVFAQHNYCVTNMMARGYYAQKPGATLGDVFKTGRNIYVDNPKLIQSNAENHQGIAINTMAYNFAGDPMLPLRVPGNTVKVTSINSTPVDGSTISVVPLERQRLEGEILSPSGEVDTSFNGVLTMTVYDGNHVASTAHNADEANPAVEIEIDENTLQEVKFDIRDGRFSGEFSFAIPTYVGDKNRVSFYAVTTDCDRTAVGYLDGLCVSQEAAAGTEVSAPVISSMYAADTELSDNDCLPGDFMLYATVEPVEVGLLGRSDRMGEGVSILLDNSKKLDGVDGYFNVNTDGSASLAYPVSALPDGTHLLTLKVVNVAGVSAEKSVSVNVVNVAEARTVVDASLAREEAVIDIEHQFADAPVGRLVVLDAAGRTVFSKDNVGFPYSWNLSGNDGSEVADGVYSACVYFKSGRRYGFAAPAPVVVGR